MLMTLLNKNNSADDELKLMTAKRNRAYRANKTMVNKTFNQTVGTETEKMCHITLCHGPDVRKM